MQQLIFSTKVQKRPYMMPAILTQQVTLTQIMAGSDDPKVQTTDQKADIGYDALGKSNYFNAWDDDE